MIVVLMGVLVLAVLADLAVHRIPNALIMAGLGIGLIIRYMAEGPPGLLSSVKDVIIAFFVFYIFYLLRALSAGDVKLIILEASYLGATDAAKILSTSFVIGALYGCLKLLYRSITSKENNKEEVGELQNYDNFRFDLKQLISLWKYPSVLFQTLWSYVDNQMELTRIPFAPFIMMGTLIVLFVI